MIRRFGTLIVTTLVVLTAGLAVPATPAVVAAPELAKLHAAPWKPPAGAAFNNPVGRVGARTALVGRVLNAVKHTPKGATIRLAMYSFDRRTIADALINAHRRGVHVQMVVNDNWTSRATKRLRRVLGHNPRQRHFVVICKGSCRGGPGNLHMKVYAFSQTGASHNVVMTGSSNLTDRAVSLQWNDLFTLREADGLHATFIKVFNQLKFDRRVSPRRVTYKSGPYDATFYRRAGQANQTQSRALPGPNEDPVMQRLKAIRCSAVKGAGINGHTVIRITMYGWGSERGKWLAERIAYMKRHGCNISVILSVAGGSVLKTLRASHVPVRSADYDYNEEGVVNFYSHLKVLAVNGNYQGKPVHTVWTGSENWSTMSFRNDELILQISGAFNYRRYVGRFGFMWKHATHAFGIHPTGRP